MIRRIKTSYRLLECSLWVLSQNLKLLFFPLVSFSAICFIVLFFIGSFLFQPTGHSYSEKAHWKAVATSIFTTESIHQIEHAKDQPGQSKPELKLNQTGLFLSVAFYFFAMFLATFFNVAFYHQILEALNGQPVSLKNGLKFAVSRFTPILLWSVFAGLVGYLIKMLEQRMGLIGKITVRLIGLAWSVASVFAIPVIICEHRISNPLSVLKMSAFTLKKAWGETLIGFFGHSSATAMIIIGSAIPMVISIYLASILHATIAMAAIVIAWFLFVLTFGYISGVAGNVFQCALYLFASSGNVPAGYSREMMDVAWKTKKTTT